MECSSNKIRDKAILIAKFELSNIGIVVTSSELIHQYFMFKY